MLEVELDDDVIVQLVEVVLVDLADMAQVIIDETPLDIDDEVVDDGVMVNDEIDINEYLSLDTLQLVDMI